MSEQIETLLTQIATDDKESAVETLNQILAQKAAEALEAKKSEVIQAHFGDKE
jgi:RNA binding exosome subunit